METPNDSWKLAIPPEEEENMKIVSRFVAEHYRDMQAMIRKFENMGSFKRWWDSKVPESEKSGCNRRNYTSSNREEVIKEIKKYLEFYEAMSTAAKKIYDEELRSESEKYDPQSISVALREMLNKMMKKAELGRYFTDSTAVYKIHKNFQRNRQMLESMVKNVEVVLLKQGMEKAKQHQIESNKKIDNLTKSMEEFNRRYDDLTELVRLKMQNAEEDGRNSRENQARLEEQNREDRRNFRENQARLEEQNKRLDDQNKQAFEDKRKFEELQAGKFGEQQARLDVLISQNMELTELCKQLLSDKQKVEKDKDRLEKENEFLLEMAGQ